MALIPGTLPTGTKYPNDPQSLLDTFASYLTAPEAKKNRPTVSVYTPAAGATVTALTVTATGLTLRGSAVTALTASQCVEWQKVAANTWIRLQ